MECIRANYFPQYLSRLQCLYAVEEIKELEPWSEFFSKNGASIWEVESNSESIKKFDARNLRTAFLTDPSDLSQKFKYAFNYWNLSPTTSPLPEVLLPFPVRIVRRVGRYI